MADDPPRLPSSPPAPLHAGDAQLTWLGSLRREMDLADGGNGGVGLENGSGRRFVMHARPATPSATDRTT